MVDEDDEAVLDELGNAEYTFDFEVWQQPEGGADAGGGGGEPEKIRVFMRNHIAEQCQHIEPNDRVTITGAGVSFRSALATEEGAVTVHAIVSEPCVVKLQQVLPRSPGDASTQLAYPKQASTLTFPAIDSNGSSAGGGAGGGAAKASGAAHSGGAAQRGNRGAPRPKGPSLPEKRVRKAAAGGGGGGGAGGGAKPNYQYTPLAQLNLGVGNFYGVVVNATFPRKTKNDYLAT